MKYTVSINEKKRTVTVNLDGYEGVARCCPTDCFNVQTGVELALERAKVAKANAENNHEMDVEKLYVASIVANQGPTMKRFMPRAMGRATMIRKRTSHIEVVLKERK